MTDSTPRHQLPMITPGQAQKELSHNEALAMLDLLAHPYVEAVGIDSPPADPSPGQAWIVGAEPTDAWVGHAHALAGWTAGGWRFVSARAGMTVRTPTGFARFEAGAWVAGVLDGTILKLAGLQVVGARQPAVPDPVGGSIVDAEARAAIGALLAAARTHGLIAV